MTQDDLRTAVHAALRNWTEQTGKGNTFLESLLLVQLKREQMSGNSPTTRRLAANQVLLAGIDTLRIQNETSANLLTARFLDGEKAQALAYKLHMSIDQIKRRQRDAITGLTQIIWEQETAVRAEQAHTLKAKLMPASYTQLFGLQAQQQSLVHQLTDTNDHWITALVGIGGIGKTTLADAVVRDLIDRFIFEQIIWLRIEKSKEGVTPEKIRHNLISQLAERCGLDSATNSAFSEKYAQIRRLLKIMPMLVVIDNLESEADTLTIAEHLQDLANPSKFLLTTRTRLPETAAVRTVYLKELSQSDSFQLIKHHARSIGLTEVARADDATLLPVFETIGGNPLALKLVVGLADILPLPQILANLTRVKHKAIIDMYRHIYWQSWSLLSENGRLLLEMMPMAADIGMSPEQMIAVSGLTEQNLWAAITELANRSLLEVRGTTWDRRYGIHRLTETFLQTEIIHWPEETAV